MNSLNMLAVLLETKFKVQQKRGSEKLSTADEQCVHSMS